MGGGACAQKAGCSDERLNETKGKKPKVNHKQGWGVPTGPQKSEREEGCLKARTQEISRRSRIQGRVIKRFRGGEEIKKGGSQKGDCDA